MLLSLLLLASTSPDINVGRFDPADFPNARKARRILPQSTLNRQVERVLAERQCRISGQTYDRFDFAVPYAVLLDSTGEAKKLVVKEIGCAPIETLVGRVVIALSSAGDFDAQHGSGEHWYVGEVTFAQGREQYALAAEDPDKLICRKAEPKLGSRIAMRQVCKTAAEWRAYYVDRDQQARDIQNAGVGRSDPACFSRSSTPTGCD